MGDERDWQAQRDAVARWTERARVALLVGEGAAAMLDQLKEGAGASARLAAVLDAVLERGGFGPGGVVAPRDEPPPAATSDGRSREPRRAGKAEAATATPWRDGERVLDGESYVVLFLGAVMVRSAWATVALGVQGDGRKRVLALWRGCTADVAVARAATDNLVARGLSAAGGLLVVADGSPALDQAVRRAWGARALVAHCEQSVATQVLGHLAERERPRIRQAFRAAWAASGPERGRQLSGLAESLGTSCPGAAARLRRSLEALCTVSGLDLPGQLAGHLRGIGPIRELAEAAREAGGSGAAGIAAVLPERLARMRRLIGAQALPLLAERLATLAR